MLQLVTPAALLAWAYPASLPSPVRAAQPAGVMPVELPMTLGAAARGYAELGEAKSVAGRTAGTDASAQNT